MQITLKAARVNADMRQEEAAKALGISVSTLIKWERNPEHISALRQRDLARVYGIPVDNIIFLSAE